MPTARGVRDSHAATYVRVRHMFVTIVEGAVEADREDDLRSAWEEVTAGARPPGFIESSLLNRGRHVADRDGVGVEGSGHGDGGPAEPPGALVVFERGGATPTVSMSTVEGRVEPDHSALGLSSGPGPSPYRSPRAGRFGSPPGALYRYRSTEPRRSPRASDRVRRAASVAPQGTLNWSSVATRSSTAGELAVRHRHAVVGFAHAATGIRARSAGRLTDLIHEHLLQPGDVRARELPVDPVVARAASDERVHDGRDRIQTTQPLEQRCHRVPLPDRFRRIPP